MNKEVQIIISARDAASRIVRDLGNNINRVSGTAKRQLTAISTSINKIGDSARALALPLAAASTAMVATGNTFVKTAYRAEMGGRLFNSMLSRVGENISLVNSQVKDLAAEIKIPTQVIEQNAAELLRHGYNFEQIAGIYRGAAASGLLIGKTTEKSIEKVTEALVTQLSVHLNQIGIVQNLSRAYQDYAEELGTTKDELTDAERAEASYRMVMKATEAELEDMPRLLSGYGGAVADLGREWFITKNIIGKEVMPVWVKFLQTGTNLLNTFNELDEEQKDIIFGVGKVASGAVAAAAGLGLLASAGSLVGKVFGILSGITGLIVNPLVIGGIAIAAVGTALYTAWDKDWGGVKTKITGFVDSAIEKFDAIKNWWNESNLKKIVTDAWNELTTIWTDETLTLPQKLIETGKVTFTTLKILAVEAWEWFENVVIPLLEPTFNKVKIAAVTAWEWTEANIIPLLEATFEKVKVKAVKVWDWADAEVPLVTDTIKATIKFMGETYNQLKEGNYTNLFYLGGKAIQLYIGLKIAQGAVGLLIANVSRLVSKGLFKVKGFTTGIYGLAAITVGLKLLEAFEGDFESIGREFLGAVIGGMAGAVIGGPKGAAIGLTVGLMFDSFFTGWGSRNVSDNVLGVGPGGPGGQNPVPNPLLSFYNSQFLKDFTDAYKNVWVNPIINLLKGTDKPTWLDGLIDKLDDLINKIGGKGFATGGKAVGPGTGTSDSILARISNGEYIVNAEATKRWLPLLEAINAGKIPGFFKGGLAGMVPGLTGNLNLDIANVGEFINDISENISKMVSRVIDVFVSTFQFIGELLIELAKNIFGEEQVNSALKILEKFKITIEDLFMGTKEPDKEVNLYGGPRPLTIGIRFADSLENTIPWLDRLKFGIMGITDAVVQKIPLLDNIVARDEEGSITGIKSLSDVFMFLLTQSKAFQTLMEAINPVLQALADVVGVVLLPILKILEPPLKGLANLLKWVAEIIVKVWNTLLDLISKLPFVNLRKYKISLDDLTDSTDDMNEQIQEAIKNMPRGFKIATARFEAAHAVQNTSIPNVKNNQSGGGNQYISITIGEVNNVEDLEQTIIQAINKAQTRRNRTLHGLTTGGAY